MADEKGIKFYLVQTEEGPQLEHLQAEAKKRDPSFQTIHIDTTKQPLMDRLNELMRRAHAAETGGETPAPRPAAKPGEIGSFKEGNVPAGDNKWHGDDHLVQSGQACNVCMTRKAIAEWRGSTEASVAVEEVVGSLTEPVHLANIKVLIEDREQQLATEGKAAVKSTSNDPLPTPKTKQWGKKK